MRVVVIGGGLVGLCSAYYLRQAGFEVVLLEREGPDHETCSHGNAGMIVPSHVVPLASPSNLRLGLRMLGRRSAPFSLRIRPDWHLLRWLLLFSRSAREHYVRRCAPVLHALHLASRAEYIALEEDLPGGFGLSTHGLLMVCATEAGLREEHEAAHLAHTLGMPAQAMNESDVRELEGKWKLHCLGGVFYPQDCHLTPHRLMARLRDVLSRRGVEFRWSTAALGWSLAGGRPRAVRTSVEEVAGDIFVVASGVWSRRLLQPLGADLPLLGGKGYSISLAPLADPPSLCAILTEARVAVTPMLDCLRFAGTMELGAQSPHVSGGRARAMVRSIARYLSAFPPAVFEGSPVWAGLRPCTPDGMPYLGAMAEHPNVLVATGHAMLGISLAPITGKMVAQIAAGMPPQVSLELLSPERFSGRPRISLRKAREP